MVNKQPKKTKGGAPKKPKGERKNLNTGFTQVQMDWISKEAKGRGVARAEIHREAMDMYITAVESQRGDSVVEELFQDNK